MTKEPVALLEKRDREPEGKADLAEALGGGFVPCPVTCEAGAEPSCLAVEEGRPGAGRNGFDESQQLLDLALLTKRERCFDRFDDSLA